jgi:putative membrane protein
MAGEKRRIWTRMWNPRLVSFTQEDFMRKRQTALIGLLFASFVTVHAQQPAGTQPPSPQGASTLAPADREFMVTAAADGHKELELARIAGQKAASQAVRELAQRIEKDHAQADWELKSLAQSKRVTLPTPDHKTTIATLEKDANFDRTYSTMMVADHKKAIALFERAAKSSDADVKAFAEKTLPALREHLTLSQVASTATSSANRPTSGATGTSGTVKSDTTSPAPREE